jgi:hypothetical protein
MVRDVGRMGNGRARRLDPSIETFQSEGMLEPAKVKANEANGKIASTWMTSLPDLGLWGACHAIKKHMTKMVRTIEWTGKHDASRALARSARSFHDATPDDQDSTHGV